MQDPQADAMQRVKHLGTLSPKQGVSPQGSKNPMKRRWKEHEGQRDGGHQELKV